MFSGDLPCPRGGELAAEALEDYVRKGDAQGKRVRMPAGVVEVLRKSLRESPAERWSDLAEAAAQLQRVYQREIGKKYPRPLARLERRGRPVPPVGAATGAEWQDPRPCLRSALEEEGRDPGLAESLVPRGHGSRRAQAVADLAVFDEALRIYERLIAAGRGEINDRLADLCQRKALVHQHLGDGPGALGMCDRAIAIYERLAEQDSWWEFARDLAVAWTRKANMLQGLDDRRGAVALYDRAIAVIERLSEQEGVGELRATLAGVYMNKAIVVEGLGDVPAAVALYDRAKRAVGTPPGTGGRRELGPGLGQRVAQQGRGAAADVGSSRGDGSVRPGDTDVGAFGGAGGWTRTDERSGPSLRHASYYGGGIGRSAWSGGVV